MKIAVITDIHANIDALEAVFADCDAGGVDEVIALGDLVGYGPEPEAVIQLLIARGVPSVMGNHELALLDDDYLSQFYPDAAKVIRLHRQWLSGQSMAYLSELPRFIVKYGTRFVHGLPPDSITDYVSRTPEKRLSRIIELQKQPLSFTGHTHLMSTLQFKAGNLLQYDFSPESSPLHLEEGGRYLINAGSVGQPRDNFWQAKYVIWDRGEHLVEPRYVVYDNRQAAERGKKKGLPKRFSSKLL